MRGRPHLPALAVPIAGSIPAAAGLSCCPCVRCMPRPVHPRARGAGGRGRLKPVERAGASPRARGRLALERTAEADRRCIPAAAGSVASENAGTGPSPRSRGRRLEAQGGQGDQGRIPARAGSRSPPLLCGGLVAPSVSPTVLRLPLVHPCVRGVYRNRDHGHPVHPRARGADDPVQAGANHQSASSPPPRAVRARRTIRLAGAKAHPRACGVNVELFQHRCVGVVHPRARGATVHLACQACRRLGCIPARAGVTMFVIVAVHLRAGRPGRCACGGWCDLPAW